MSGKLVTFGLFRGLAPRHAGTSLAGFGRLFQSPLEGAPAPPVLSKKKKKRIHLPISFPPLLFCARVRGFSVFAKKEEYFQMFSSRHDSNHPISFPPLLFCARVRGFS